MHTTTTPPPSSSGTQMIARRPPHRQRKACPNAASRRLTLLQLLSPAPRSLFIPQVYQSVHHAIVRLETRGGHVNNRREKDIEQERWEQPLTKALFHSEPLRAGPVVEPHACSHAIVELMNDRDHSLWHAKTGEYCPETSLISGVARFGRTDKPYIQVNTFFRASSCNRRIINIVSVVERFGRKSLCTSGRIPTRSQYSLRRRAMIFSSILPACATSEMPL